MDKLEEAVRGLFDFAAQDGVEFGKFLGKVKVYNELLEYKVTRNSLMTVLEMDENELINFEKIINDNTYEEIFEEFLNIGREKCNFLLLLSTLGMAEDSEFMDKKENIEEIYISGLIRSIYSHINTEVEEAYRIINSSLSEEEINKIFPSNPERDRLQSIVYMDACVYPQLIQITMDLKEDINKYTSNPLYKKIIEEDSNWWIKRAFLRLYDHEGIESVYNFLRINHSELNREDIEVIAFVIKENRDKWEENLKRELENFEKNHLTNLSLEEKNEFLELFKRYYVYNVVQGALLSHNKLFYDMGNLIKNSDNELNISELKNDIYDLILDDLKNV